jgi:hypothetical protein
VAAIPDPTISSSDRRTVVVIVGDPLGWTIDGVISGVVVRTPVPLSARVAAEYLRAWLPEVLAVPDSARSGRGRVRDRADPMNP